MARRRPFALAVALIALVLAGPAVAKKKKGGAKKHKTPSGKSVDKESKDTSEAADDSSSSSAADEKEEESKPSVKATPPEGGDEKASEPVEGEEKEKEKKPTKKAAAAEPDEGSGALPALELVLGGGAMFRYLAYADHRNTSVAPYSLAPGPEARVAFEFFPAALASSGFAGNIGVIGQLGYGFGVKSQTMAGSQLVTRFQDFAVGLKLRIPLGMVNPYASGSYVVQAFQLDGQTPTTGVPVPAVGYKIIRIGAGARFVFTPMVDLDVGGGFLLLTDAGQIKSAYWPHTTGNGFEAAASLGFRFTPLIGVRAGVDFRQYGLAFNWRMGEPNQSGGALDRYIVAWGGLQITLDGVGGGSDEPPAEEKPKKGKKKKPEPEPTDEPTE